MGHHLLPRMTGTGLLNVRYSAKPVAVADRNGKSDPFARIYIDDILVHTTEVRKTLDPVWEKQMQDPDMIPDMALFERSTVRIELWNDDEPFLEPIPWVAFRSTGQTS